MTRFSSLRLIPSCHRTIPINYFFDNFLIIYLIFRIVLPPKKNIIDKPLYTQQTLETTSIPIEMKNIEQSPPIYNKLPAKYQSYSQKNNYQDSLDMFQKEYHNNPPGDVSNNVNNDNLPTNNMNNNSELLGNEETLLRNSKTIKKQVSQHSYSVDIFGGRFKKSDGEERRFSKKFGRGQGIKFMFENPEIIAQTTSLILPKSTKNDNNKDQNMGCDYYNKLKDNMLSNNSNIKYTLEQGKNGFFLGAPRYYPKEKNHGENAYQPQVKYYSVKALKNLDNVPLP